MNFIETIQYPKKIPFVWGFAFGILQSCLFLSVQIYYTATIIGYFLILGAWLAGVIYALKIKKPLKLSPSILLALAAYMLLFFILRQLPPSPYLLPVIAILSAAVGQTAGTLLCFLSKKIDTAKVLFHENNGFVVGLVASMLLFTQFGQRFLIFGPLLSICLALIAIVEKKKSQHQKHLPPTEAGERHIKIFLILFFAGLNSFLLQFFIIRNFSTVLRASELTFILTATFYMAGYSLGFFIGPKLPGWAIRLGCIFSLPLTLVILIFAKPLASLLIANSFGMGAIILLLFLATWGSSSFYSLLLPVTLNQYKLDFKEGYLIDMTGALSGLLVLVFLGHVAPNLIGPLSMGVLAGLSYLLLKKERLWVTPVHLLLLVLFCIYQQDLVLAASADFYASRGVQNPKVLFSGDSFYHSVDIVESYSDKNQTNKIARQSYLNGVKYFETLYNSDGSLNESESSLSEFTYFLAELPAKYLYTKLGRPLRVLIMGGGSLTNIRRVSPYASELLLVEIDPLVIKTSSEFWKESNQLSQFPQAKIIQDDVRHFLAKQKEPFDLIINDISAPYYLGTALLHSENIYRLVSAYLRPEGLFAESTQSRPIPEAINSSAMKILKGIDIVFPYYRVVDGQKNPRGKRGYVYATKSEFLTTATLTSLMKQDNKYEGTSTFSENSSRFRLAKVKPFSLNNIETLLTSNYRLIKERFEINSHQSRDLVQQIMNLNIWKVFKH